MPDEPLDYHNPRARPDPAPTPPPRPAAGPVAAVPAEFDALLTETDDHAAVNVIETVLRAAKIPTHRVAGDALVKRPVKLFVHADDHDRAAVLAAAIFARRQRIKTLLPPKPKAPDADTRDPLPYGPMIF